MKALKWFAVAAMLFISISAFAQTTTVFNLTPIPLTNGWKVTGTITTDGTVGALGAANIVDWNLKVVQTTDLKWTEKDSNDLNMSGVVTDGSRVIVATSPDGVSDGGVLYFGRFGSGGNIPTNAVMADFTQLGVNLGYVGGIAGWVLITSASTKETTPTIARHWPWQVSQTYFASRYRPFRRAHY